MDEAPVRYRDTRLIDDDCRMFSGDVLLHEDGSWSESNGDEDVRHDIDGSTRLITRSLQNWHTHLAMVLNRGIGEGLDLQAWLEQSIFPSEERLTAEYVDIATRAACAELIATGTSFACDMYYFPQSMASALSSSGLRGISCGTITDFPTTSYPDGPQQALSRLDVLLKEGTGCERVEYGVAPHAIYTCAEETLRAASELASKHDALLHTHISETRKEVADCQAAHGRYPVEYLDSIDFLDHHRTALAHCGWLKKNEMRMLAAADAKAVHCPLSNMKLGIGGTMSYPAMREAGVDVRLGTDGAGTNNSLDLLQEAKMASLVQRHAHWDSTLLDQVETWRMATKGSQDWVAWNLDDMRMRPHGIDGRRLLANLVYSGTDCLDMWVGGEELRHGGLTLSVDVEATASALEDVVGEYYADI